ncbi:terminase, partial (plasmid) [Escherichia coli]
MCISSPETNSWSVIYRKNSGEDINSKRLVRTVLIFTESSDQLSRATDRVPG